MNKTEKRIREQIEHTEEPRFIKIIDDYVKFSKSFKKDKTITREPPSLLAYQVFENDLKNYFINLNERDKKLFIYIHFSRQNIKEVKNILRMLSAPFNRFDDSYIFETDFNKFREKDSALWGRENARSDESLAGELDYRYKQMVKSNIYTYYGTDRVRSVMNTLYERDMYSIEAVLDTLEIWSLPEYKDCPLSWVLNITEIA